MKHIALRARSVNIPNRPYTTPGLGDRIHSCIVAWCYSQAHDTPVTLHLTADKWTGGQFQNKPESWAEVIRLFPNGSVAVKAHPVTPANEPDWMAYLQGKGIDAELYWYGDHPGKYESVEALDISLYLKQIPRLNASPQSTVLPSKFITVQWDSNQSRRTLTPDKRKRVMQQYPEYHHLTVGGEGKDPYQMSLAHIAHAMSHAELHVGVDSAFMHMAQLYMPPERIHLYNEPDGYYSHHALRAVDNGSVLNRHYP